MINYYLFLKKIKLSWESAKTSCEDEKMELVPIKTQKEKRRILDFISKNFSGNFVTFWTAKNIDELGYLKNYVSYYKQRINLWTNSLTFFKTYSICYRKGIIPENLAENTTKQIEEEDFECDCEL